MKQQLRGFSIQDTSVSVHVGAISVPVNRTLSQNFLNEIESEDFLTECFQSDTYNIVVPLSEIGDGEIANGLREIFSEPSPKPFQDTDATDLTKKGFYILADGLHKATRSVLSGKARSTPPVRRRQKSPAQRATPAQQGSVQNQQAGCSHVQQTIRNQAQQTLNKTTKKQQKAAEAALRKKKKAEAEAIRQAKELQKKTHGNIKQKRGLPTVELQKTQNLLDLKDDIVLIKKLTLVLKGMPVLLQDVNNIINLDTEFSKFIKQIITLYKSNPDTQKTHLSTQYKKRSTLLFKPSITNTTVLGKTLYTFAGKMDTYVYLESIQKNFVIIAHSQNWTLDDSRVFHKDHVETSEWKRIFYLLI